MNMQQVQQIKRELKIVKEKHKNDKLNTFETNISDMADDCIKAIEYLVDVVEIIESAYHDK